MKESVDSTPSVTPASVPPIDYALRRANCALSKHRLLTLLRTQKPEFYRLAEVVGRQVWISFEGKQASDVTTALSQLGFHWSGQYRAWIHRCGWIDRRTMPHPRGRFGSFFPADFFRA